MDGIIYKLKGFKMEEDKQIFTSNESQMPITMPPNCNGRNSVDGSYARVASSFQTPGSEIFPTTQRDTAAGEMPPPNTDIGDSLNYSINGTEIFEDQDSNPFHYFAGARRSDSGPWSDAINNNQYYGGTGNQTFDFLLKSLLSANNFVSLLNREQLEVLRSIRPSLLCDILQEVATLRINQRVRRTLPNCCKTADRLTAYLEFKLPSLMGAYNASGIVNTLLSHKDTGTWVTNSGTQHKVTMAAYLRPKVVAIQMGLGPYHVARVGSIVTFYDRPIPAAEECAFCKNNGESEEHYASHGLKDARGRVLCPVLRAFRCPRCGATGDRAHTIKYCPENPDETTSASTNSLSWRRRPASSFLGQPLTADRIFSAAPTPSPSPSQSPSTMPPTSVWTGFGMN